MTLPDPTLLGQNAPTGNRASSPAVPTSSTGVFDPTASAAGAVTDPGTTHTDVYGLTADQEAWSFYTGVSQNPFDATVESRAARARLSRANPGEVHDAPTAPAYERAIDLMKYFSALGVSPDPKKRQAFANFQNQLLAIGAYGTSGGSMLYRPGVWTDLDAKAMLKAFQSYQQVGGKDGAGQPLTFSEYVDQAAGQSAANGQAGGASNGSGGGSGPVLNLADPATLRQSAQQAAQAALGRNLSSDELNRFVDEFHNQQQGAFNEANAKGATSYVDAGSPSAAAQTFVAQGHAEEAGQHQVLGYADALLNHLMSGSGELPTTQVDPTVATA